jgi:hypothetical protein
MCAILHPAPDQQSSSLFQTEMMTRATLNVRFQPEIQPNSISSTK